MTKLDVFNMALDLIGAKPVTAVDQATPSAEACQRNFKWALLEVLRAGDWRTAKARATLVEDASTPDFGWAHQFVLPTDFVSIVKLNGVEVSNAPGDFFEIEGAYLMTDEETANIEYIRKPDDVEDPPAS